MTKIKGRCLPGIYLLSPAGEKYPRHHEMKYNPPGNILREFGLVGVYYE